MAVTISYQIPRAFERKLCINRKIELPRETLKLLIARINVQSPVNCSQNIYRHLLHLNISVNYADSTTVDPIMSSPSNKKIKRMEEKDSDYGSGNKVFFGGLKLYFCPGGIGPKRQELMKSSASKNGFVVFSNFTPEVTHVLSELSYQEDVLNHEKNEINLDSWGGLILETRWLFDCIKSHSVIPEAAYILPNKLLPTEKTDTVSEESTSTVPGFDLGKFNECVAERRAILDHPNKNISEALDLLREYWELCQQSSTDGLRALAFARAAAAVKCLPFKVTHADQLKGIKDLGSEHALRVATQIVESGHCPEVEEKRNDEKYKSYKILCMVYGVGPKTAKKWYSLGFRTADDVKNRFSQLDVNNTMITYGVPFLDDLTRPLLLAEAEKTYKYITGLGELILPSVVTSMNGGFRRGKPAGHDLDVLFSYPERDDNDDFDLIAAVRDKLDEKGLVVWSRTTKVDEPNTGVEMESTLPPPPSLSTRDHLPLSMLILKYPLDEPFEEFGQRYFSAEKDLGPFELAARRRDWRAIRVDLVGSTTCQYPFAQIGWTGNKQYNRCLRQYAKDRLGYSLSSCGLYDMHQHRSIPAQTERDIFHHLKLSYREPWERNF